MLSDPSAEATTQPPRELGGTSAALFLYVEDVDAAFRQAVDAGASATMEPADMFWGDRFGEVVDPFGQCWQLATHREDVSEAEIEERAKAAMADTA